MEKKGGDEEGQGSDEVEETRRAMRLEKVENYERRMGRRERERTMGGPAREREMDQERRRKKRGKRTTP